MFEVLAGLAGAGNTVWNSVYNYWRDQVSDNRAQRDFDYQKALQNQVFQREDTAVQRRMADLQAAGLNPNLAAGSAASAGAVVGRSSTPTSNYGGSAGNPVGTALDMAQHVAQLRAMRTEQKILNYNADKAYAEKEMALDNADYNRLQNIYDSLALLHQLGIRSGTYLRIKNGQFSINYDNNLEDGNYYFDDTPLKNQLEWQYLNNKNSADLLQKDVEWYNAQKVIDAIGAGARAAGNLGGAYYNFGRRR